MSLIREKKILIAALAIIFIHFLYTAIVGFQSLNESREIIEDGFQSGAYELKEKEVINYATIIKGEIERKIAKGDSREEIVNFIKSVSFGENGYAFAYNSYAIRIASGKDKKGIGKSYWRVEDSNGKPVIQDLIRNAKNQHMKIYRYHFPKPGDNKAYLKMSTSFFIEEYDMMVGTGIYFDDEVTDIDRAFESNIEYYLEINKDNVTTNIVFIVASLILVTLHLNSKKRKNKRAISDMAVTQE